MAYGKGAIPLRLEPGRADWHVIRPRHAPALADPFGAFLDAAAEPIAAPPLHELVGPGDRVAIVTSDGTRPVPNHLLVPWLLQALPVPAERVTILVGTGSHRANTPAELDAIFG
ncbi:MAG: DUF2088 domain-containing protein, partial [Candidatus Hydrogenedentes bacterium]|nr:DUF2088 domain-containing protein [Candidatus Hydrogenedentota bacterium]